MPIRLSMGGKRLVCTVVGGRIPHAKELRSGTRTPLIWRWDIGHYGGFLVDVPAENFTAFKALFPKGVFPRNVQQKNIVETQTDEGTIRFNRLFPGSRGRYYYIHFADGTKGERFLSQSNILHQMAVDQPDFD